MSLFRFVFFFLFSMQVFSYESLSGIELFSDLLSKNKTDECLELLDKFEIENNDSNRAL